MSNGGVVASGNYLPCCCVDAVTLDLVVDLHVI